MNDAHNTKPARPEYRCSYDSSSSEYPRHDRGGYSLMAPKPVEISNRYRFILFAAGFFMILHTLAAQQLPIAPDAGNLTFSAGDALQISIYPDTGSFLNGIYPIDENGVADLPVIGMLKVTDTPPLELERRLRSAYVTFLAQPNIQVRPLIRAAALGGFHRPGLYYLDARESLWSLIFRAGGTLREDGVRKLRWEHNNTIVSSNLAPYLESGQSLISMGFRSGDQIRVTQTPKRDTWDIFRSDVLPVLTFIVSSVTAVATTYVALESMNSTNDN